MTLIEVLITVGLLAAIVAVLGAFFARFDGLYRFQTAVRDTAGSASAAARAIDAAARAADAVAVSHAFSGVARASSTSTLVLELPSINAAGDVIVGAYDYAAFYASSTALYEALDANASSSRASSTSMLSNALASLSFSYNAANITTATSVSAVISTASSFVSGTASSTVSVQARLKNAP